MKKRKTKRNKTTAYTPRAIRTADLVHFVTLYKFMKLEAFKGTMETWSLKATLSYDANDPFEFTPKALSPTSDIDMYVNSAQGNPPPFFCFSRDIESPAMWGHYAESGTGVCMVFCFPVEFVADPWQRGKLAKSVAKIKCPSGLIPNSIKSSVENSFFKPVVYSDQRVKSAQEIENDIDSFRKELEQREPQINHDEEVQNKRFSTIEEWFLSLISTKSSQWKYEDEIRLISDYPYSSCIKEDMLLYDWPMNFFAGVVVGPRCKMSKELISKLVEQSYITKANKKSYFVSYLKPLLDPNNSCGKSFIVSQANYHWLRFEIEAAPWSKHLLGEDLWHRLMLYPFFAYKIPVNCDGCIISTKSKSWNDWQRELDKNPVNFTKTGTGTVFVPRLSQNGI